MILCFPNRKKKTSSVFVYLQIKKMVEKKSKVKKMLSKKDFKDRALDEKSEDKGKKENEFGKQQQEESALGKGKKLPVVMLVASDADSNSRAKKMQSKKDFKDRALEEKSGDNGKKESEFGKRKQEESALGKGKKLPDNSYKKSVDAEKPWKMKYRKKKVESDASEDEEYTLPKTMPLYWEIKRVKKYYEVSSDEDYVNYKTPVKKREKRQKETKMHVQELLELQKERKQLREREQVKYRISSDSEEVEIFFTKKKKKKLSSRRERLGKRQKSGILVDNKSLDTKSEEENKPEKSK